MNWSRHIVATEAQISLKQGCRPCDTAGKTLPIRNWSPIQRPLSDSDDAASRTRFSIAKTISAPHARECLY
ncbi:MAG: hypothetical protein ABL880_04835 [Methylotenera sp.]